MILENEYIAAILLVNLSTLGWVFHEPQNKFVETTSELMKCFNTAGAISPA